MNVSIKNEIFYYNLLITFFFNKGEDGHKSIYDLNFLFQNHYDSFKNRALKSEAKFLWNKYTIQSSDYARVSYVDYLSDDDVAKNVVKSLVKYGVAFVENVPPNLESTEVTIKRLFPIHKTLFGEMYTLTQDKIHSDSAYSRDFIGAHTDNTYFNDASGLQIMHCTEHIGSGGENFLIDGFKTLTDLKLKYPDVFDRLEEYNIPSEYIEPGEYHYYNAPLFKRNSITGQLEQIRVNIYDRAIFNTVPFEKVDQFYKDYRVLLNEMQSPNNEWWFKLTPGTVMFFDNWRILHGRSQFTGKRTLCGSYVSRTAFRSKARTLGIIL